MVTPVSKELAGSVPGGDTEPHTRQRDGLLQTPQTPADLRPAQVSAEFGPGALASNGDLLLVTTTALLSPEPRWPHPAPLPPAGPPRNRTPFSSSSRAAPEAHALPSRLRPLLAGGVI